MQAACKNAQEVAPLFRRSAVDAARYSLFGRPCIAVPPATPFIAAAGVLALALSGFALWAIEIPVRVSAVGMLMPPGGFLAIVASAPGSVSAVHVTEGDPVGADDLLFETEPSRTGATRVTLSSKELDSLKLELQMLNVVSSRRRDAHMARLETFAREKEAAVERLEQFARRQAAAAEEIAVLRDRLARIRSLSVDGHLPRDAEDQEQLALIRARSAAAAIDAERDALHAEITRLDGHREGTLRDMALADAEDAVKREALNRQIDRQTHLVTRRVRAPASGTVARMFVRLGASVRTDQVLAKIIAEHKHPEAWLYVAAAGVRRIDIGEVIELQLDAWPAAEFGTRRARVVSVSKVPLAPSELPAPLMVAGPVFEVRAEIQEHRPGAPELLTGATIKAQIINRRLRLYRWLTRKLATGKSADRV